MGRWSLFTSLALLFACSANRDFIASTDRNDISEVVENAKSYLGTRYKYAGNSRKGLDCSGLVALVYKDAGIALPRNTTDQSKEGRTINQSSMRPGDLIFFKRKGKVFHVAIASRIHKDQIWMIHSSTSKGVIEQELSSNSYWMPKLFRIQRVL